MSSSIAELSIVKVCKIHGDLNEFEVYRHKGRKEGESFYYVCKKCSSKGKNKRDRDYLNRKRNDENWLLRRKVISRKTAAKFRISNRLLINDIQRNYTINLKDPYVKRRFCAGTILKTKEIPNEVIELKRLSLLLIRAIKEYKNG